MCWFIQTWCTVAPKGGATGPAYWALAARHWSMLRWKKAERELGLNPKALLPFGAQAQVKRRPWELLGPDGTKKGRQRVDRTQPALLLRPCDDLPGGYWVEAQGAAKDPDELVLFPCTTIFSNIKESPVLELEGVAEEQEPSPPGKRVKGQNLRLDSQMKRIRPCLHLLILQFVIGWCQKAQPLHCVLMWAPCARFASGGRVRP